MDKLFQFTLENGIRVVHKQVATTQILHGGIILDVGSRDELPEEHGIAHFWEHMAFKGTRRRKAYHIINSLDSVGGELNAYTTKEKICFYASVLDRFAERGISLLADITFDSIFPDKQIEKERQVILEEMAMYRDTPEDAIQDDFDHIVFKDHGLGHNILGSKDTIRSFQRDDFNAFINRNLDTSRVVVSFVGNVPAKRIKYFCEKYLSDIPSTSTFRKRTPFHDYQPDHSLTHRDIQQAHHAMGCPAYAIDDPRRTIFTMLVSLLGGASMNTRLNMALREKLGYVYTVEANYAPMTDAGLFSIFFATDERHLERSKRVINREMKRLKDSKLGSRQLHGLKDMMMGQMAMAEEQHAGLMLMMGRSLLDLNRIDSFQELVTKIEHTTSMEILTLANDIFLEEQFSALTYLPSN